MEGKLSKYKKVFGTPRLDKLQYPYYIEIIKQAIVDGVLAEDEIMPRTTELARIYGKHRVTIAAAYNVLFDEKIIYRKNVRILAERKD